MDNYTSVLRMDELVFDKIEFNRKGFRTENPLEYKLQVEIGTLESEAYKVTRVLNGNKKYEYEFEISLSGFFTLETDEKLSDEQKQHLISKNTVAIMMPYLRSQVSLLSAQPGMESIVMPIFNVNDMIEK